MKAAILLFATMITLVHGADAQNTSRTDTAHTLCCPDSNSISLSRNYPVSPGKKLIIPSDPEHYNRATLSDAQGVLIKSVAIGETTVVMDLSDCTPGSYILQLSGDVLMDYEVIIP